MLLYFVSVETWAWLMLLSCLVSGIGIALLVRNDRKNHSDS